MDELSVDSKKELESLKESISNLNGLLKDVYESMVGNISGKVGIQTQVRDNSAEILLIKQNLIAITTSISKLDFEINALKPDIKKLESTVLDIIPEIDDSKKKKNIFYGIVIAIGAVISFIVWILKFVIK